MKFQWEFKVAADLQAKLLLWGQVSELVNMQGCWPSNCFQRCSSRWIQMCGGRKHASFQTTRCSHFKGIENPAPTLSDAAVNLGLHSWKSGSGWRRYGNRCTESRLGPWSSQGGSSWTGQRGEENDWQAQPIKHEVECEGMQLHCSANILGTHA